MMVRYDEGRLCCGYVPHIETRVSGDIFAVLREFRVRCYECKRATTWCVRERDAKTLWNNDDIAEDE